MYRSKIWAVCLQLSLIHHFTFDHVLLVKYGRITRICRKQLYCIEGGLRPFLHASRTVSEPAVHWHTARHQDVRVCTHGIYCTRMILIYYWNFYEIHGDTANVARIMISYCNRFQAGGRAHCHMLI